MLSAVIALILAAAPTATGGQARYEACVAAKTTNADWAACGSAYVTRVDAALNAEWQRLNATVDGQTKADLVAEQRAWLRYRQSACRFYANGDWGREGQVLHYFGCVGGVIQRRTRELADYRAFAGPR